MAEEYKMEEICILTIAPSNTILSHPPLPV